MNKKELSRKRNLFLIGSARGVKRFFIVNKFIQEFPDAKVINTGNLIQKLINGLGFKDLDSISIINYYKLIEPMFVEIILSHLEHSDVILDTHYYYLIPGMSIKEILKFKNKIKNTILVLVEENEEEIIQANNQEWFKSIKNVEEDIILNKYSFYNYEKIFKDFSNVYSISINLNKDYEDKLKLIIEKIKNMGEIKNGN